MLRNAVSRCLLLPTRQNVPTSSSFSFPGRMLVSTHATAPSNEVLPSTINTGTEIPPLDPSSSANPNPVTGTVTSSLNATDSDTKGRGTRREKVLRPKRVKCFLCNQRGHVAKFCPTAAEVVTATATANGEVEGQGQGVEEGKEVAEVPEVCFNCGQKGHIKRDCPEPKRCWHCGSTGHVASACTQSPASESSPPSALNWRKWS